MRKLSLLVATTVMVVASLIATDPSPAGAATNGWPHSIVNGFSTPSGNGFWLVYADGTVTPQGGAQSYGDASNIALNGPIVGGATTPNGKGYWLVAQDGGIFTFGNAKFYGSMGSTPLNQPVFSMSPTKSGKGYRMVASDGGIFSFGDVPFYGSLPSLGINVTDVVGMAPIPSNRGYWIARSTGQVYSFGNAKALGSYAASSCNPIAAIFSNPAAQGYRLVTNSGATIPFGTAPGGTQITGNPRSCPNPPTMSLAEYNSIQLGDSYADVVTLVGSPGVLISQSNIGGNITQTYKWLGSGTSGANANVTFRNNQVISKAQYGLT